MQAQENDKDMCMFAGCTELDLLPGRCKHCRRLFCSKHITIAAHQCASHKDHQAPLCPLCNQVVPLAPGITPDVAVSRHIDAGCRSTKASTSRQNYCSFGGCTRNEIVLMLCNRCGQSYCLEHRHAAQHKCPVTTPPPQVAKSDLPRDRTTSPSSMPLKLTEMQMQNKSSSAIGLSKLSDPSKTVVLRTFFEPNLRIQPIYFAFSSTSSLGKVLDSICKHVDINNENNKASIPENQRWQLFTFQSETPLNLSLLLQDSGLKSNDPLILVKGSTLPAALAKELEVVRSASR